MNAVPHGSGGAPSQSLARSVAGAPTARDRAFIALQNAYRPHAGLMRLQAATEDRQRRPEAHESAVEPRVHAGELFGFHWHDAMWVPMFQFVLPGHELAEAPQRVAAELGHSFDGWAMASWFVQPNSWLAGHRPIEDLHERLPEVLAAARADRFVATG